MDYFDRDKRRPLLDVDPISIFSSTSSIISVFIQVTGIILLLVGLWIGVKVILEAWDLYQEPQRMERFAQAIERGSNIDKMLTPLRQTGENPAPEDNFRMSYFFAWAIALVLLLVIAKIAVWTIRMGGELALHEDGLQRLAQEQDRKPVATQGR
jgi:disulfide bond formation protein DsbB